MRSMKILSTLSLTVPLAACSTTSDLYPWEADQRAWNRRHAEIVHNQLYPPAQPAQAQPAPWVYSAPYLAPQPVPRSGVTCEFLGRTLYCD